MSDTSPGASEDAAGRFRALEAHADFSAWMQHTPANPRIHKLALLAFVLGLMVIGLLLAGGIATICAPLAFVPMILVGFGIYGLLRQFLQSSGADQAHLDRLPLLIVGERTQITGEGATTTRYLHTVELRDGTQRDLETARNIIHRVQIGHMGIGFVRGTTLVEFARLPV